MYHWALELQLLNLLHYNLCSATREATAMRRPHTATREQPLLATTREKFVQQQRPSIAKNNNLRKKKEFTEQAISGRRPLSKLAMWPAGFWETGFQLCHPENIQLFSECWSFQKIAQVKPKALLALVKWGFRRPRSFMGLCVGEQTSK